MGAPLERLAFAANLRTSDAATVGAMTELCALLSEDIGRPVEPLVARAPSALAEAVAHGHAAFAWVSPTLLLMASGLSTVVPLLACVRDGKASFHSIVFARGDAPFERLADLREARAAWVAPTSASGYLVARLTLARRGVSLDDVLADELFFDSHGAVTRAVLDGEADIGATFAHYADVDGTLELTSAGFSEDADATELRILAVSGPIPADMVVAHPRVPIRERIAFAAALSRLANCPIGSVPIRRVMGAEAFHAVGHAALLELEALMQESHAL